ncbi:MAG TPA: hypothetical protein VF982_02485 [Anaerolineales bacterium]
MQPDIAQNMLFLLTLLVDFFAMAVTLWLAFYLLARGFPSQVTLRAVLVLLALSIFFFSALYNLFHPIVGSAALRAVLLVIGLATWYSLTYQLMPVRAQKRRRWMEIGIYLLGAIAAFMLIGTRNAFIREEDNLLWVGRMGVGAPYIIYGIFLLLACAGILYNLLSDTKIGLSPQGRYLLLASLFPIAEVGYGIMALALAPPLPRLVQDLLFFCGVFLLGISVARYQTLVERRTTLQEFPISGLAVLGLAAVYALLAWRWGSEPATIAAITALAIVTHSIYDLVREFLERARLRRESAFRKQLRQLESEASGEERLQRCLQEGLDLLCRTLNASGGFIAVPRAGDYVVAASQQSMPLGSQFPASEVTGEDVCEPNTPWLPGIAWVAPASEGDPPIAIIGIARPKTRLNYSTDDLDLLAEVADRAGTIVSLSYVQPGKADQLRQLVDEFQSGESNLRFRTDEMMAAMAANPSPELIKMVEEGLRNLSDYIALGQLPLADWAGANGKSYIERGKNLQKVLMEAVEDLRPAGPRPREPLPRVWFNYAVLYDAYVECVPNREIMARLYISEGTFNRTRRNALRGLARLFLEKGQPAAIAR